LSDKITIIILTWNGLSITKNCLDSLKLTDYPSYEVVVVDNGSSDGTVEYLENLDWIKIIKNKQNLGFVRGNNIAIERTTNDVVLLNNDVIITDPLWLKKLNETANTDEKVGLVGCRLVNGKGKLMHAGTYMPYPIYWGQQTGGQEKDINQYSAVREVDGVVGACLYIKRALIDDIGMLDEDYFSYFEDTDYCLKTNEAGYRVMYDGRAQITHLENVSTKINDTEFSEMFKQSRTIFRSKWHEYYKNRYESKVMWHSLSTINTGYAVSSRSLIMSLEDNAVDVRYGYVYGLSEEEYAHPKIKAIRSKPKELSIPQVIYGQGNIFYKNSGSYKIGYSMLEVSGIPREWVDQANLLDEIWVPSKFNVETFKRSGVKKPIYVMPLGINTEYFNPDIKSYFNSDKYVFLSVFEWGERKAPEILLNAFNQEFTKKDEVVLLLKILNVDPGLDIVDEIKKLNLTSDNRAKVIILLNRDIADYQMGSLYRAADCFVLPTRGEGWGMPTLEAMSSGLPVISTDWSAQTEFMEDDICYPIQVKSMIPAIAKCPYYEGFEWADPDIDHLKQLMRHVYENRDEASQKGRLAAERIASKWTWDHAAKRIKERLLEVG